MRQLNERYVHETFDSAGVLTDFSLDYPGDFNFAYDIVDDIAAAEPDRPALMWCNPEGEEHEISFGEMKHWSDKTANFFASCGIGRGDVVMVIVRRHYQFWFIICALHKLGAIVVPVTFMLKDDDLAYRLQKSQAKMLVCTDVGDISEVAAHVVDDCPLLETLVMVAGGGGGLSLKGGITGQPENARYGSALSGRDGLLTLRINDAQHAAGWLDFNAEVSGASEDFEKRETRASDPLLAYFSSGTTGHPKMVLHAGPYALAHTLTAKHWHKVQPDGGRHYAIADTGWGKAVWGMLYGQWICEAAVFCYDFDRFVPADILALLEKYRVTTLCCPPTMYRLLYNSGAADYDLSALSWCTTAGEALNPDLFESWREATGVTMMEGFGQTETPLLICNTAGMVPKPGSMGKPSPLFDIEIRDEDGVRVMAGKVGEVCVRLNADGTHPDGIMMGYLHNDEKTREACRDGWYHTGDEAWLDEDGYYWYVGRNDDVIKSSGYRIGPFEVESVLMKHPAVAECAVTGIPDELRTMAVKATIVLADGVAGSDELKLELQNYVKRETAPYKFPRVIDFVEELPKTVNGKIRRTAIRAKDYAKANLSSPQKRGES
ncbi:MAG: AMP-binding protein [Coriobacteriia bacterium]|nr:AMP-binding protein [Coriobacteriia bacterium]MCL2537138.1 AMP-binding protein [Coriobacteriia bacterium]